MNILMCKPDFFEVAYEINPWMDTADAVDVERAKAQWQELHDIYVGLGYNVSLIEPVDGLPDMVFTANGALVIDGKVVLPRFKFPERQSETPLFEEWFKSNGYEDVMLPENDFEGEGDALVFGDYVLAGYGFRSEQTAHAELQAFFSGKTVVSLELVDSRFYHIDTCLTILDDSTLAYFPGAFSADAQAKLRELAQTVIEAQEDEALGFGLNTFSDGQNVVISADAPSLVKKIQDAGYATHPIQIDEFRKSGGGIKCLTLVLR